MTQREQRLAYITIGIAVLSVAVFYFLRPLAQRRAEALEELPALETKLEQANGTEARIAKLQRENDRILRILGNPKARLIDEDSRYEAQKDLVETLQGMNWDKPYDIGAGNFEPGEKFGVMRYQVSGKIPWDKFLEKLGDFEWGKRLMSVDSISLKHEGKMNVSMRLTLYVAPEGVISPPPELEPEPSEEKKEEKPSRKKRDKQPQG